MNFSGAGPHEIYELPEIKKRLSPVFQAGGVRSAFVFGSYATGRATEQSDIDILVDSGLRGLDFVALIEYVSGALGKNVDLIDIQHVEKNSRIEQEIKQTGIRIYGS